MALAIDGIDPKDLAARIDASPGALYKTLHDARRKLKHGLTHRERDDHRESCGSRTAAERTEARRLARRMLVCAEVEVHDRGGSRRGWEPAWRARQGPMNTIIERGATVHTRRRRQR